MLINCRLGWIILYLHDLGVGGNIRYTLGLQGASVHRDSGF